MKRINKDNFILNGMEKLLKIFSISEKQIIKFIDLSFDCFCIHIIEEKGIFLIQEILMIFWFLEMIIVNLS